jgi:hypothetical protein
MGSGGSLTLWSPSNKAGGERFLIDALFQALYFRRIWLKIVSIKASKAVIDGGTLKHDQSY